MQVTERSDSSVEDMQSLNQAQDMHASHVARYNQRDPWAANDSMAFKLNRDSIAKSILVSGKKSFRALLANGRGFQLATSRYWITTSAITLLLAASTLMAFDGI